MAPLPTIADCFRVAFDSSNGSLYPATNVMHFLAPGKTEADVAAAIVANANGDMWALSTNGTTVDQLVVTKLDGTPDGFVFPITHPNADFEGSGGTDFIPQACALLKLSTAATGRSGRGRVYLPFMPEGQQAGGVIDSTQRALVQAGWLSFANDMAADGVALAVASYKLASASQVLVLICEQQIATQRRRWHRTSA